MADPTGFLKSSGRCRGAGPSRSASGTGRTSSRPGERRGPAVPDGRGAQAGGPLHGLRHPVLPQRVARWRNLIPEWNDLARCDDWQDAIERLHATNNFPEFTGKLCPLLRGLLRAEPARSPVTIKQIEREIIDRAYDEGWVAAPDPGPASGKKVAVIGSGPAGLAAGQQLTRAGHEVTVYERADRIGGLLRYGIPEFKMEKRHLDRRLDQMARRRHPVRHRRPGRRQQDGDLSTEQLRSDFDAVVLAGGATGPP